MKKTFYCLLVIVFITGCAKKIPSAHDSARTGNSFTVTTSAATYITSLTAYSGGTISSSGGGNDVTERGVCYSTNPNPTISDFKIPSGSGSGSFNCGLTALEGSTTYYIRAYATKSSGTTYGNQVGFTTLESPETMTDSEGNIYRTIKIGSQVWMAGNLRTRKYRNGIVIPNVTDSIAWASLNSGAYCNYRNDSSYVATYGRLYNWYATTDANNIAPAGWHMPSLAEWQILGNYLGGTNEAGGHLKEAGLTHWRSPNEGADNSSGFTALPSGARYYIYLPNPLRSVFMGFDHYSPWWTSTSVNTTDAGFTEVDWSTTNMHRTLFFGEVGHRDKRSGYSVRLIKD